MSWTKLFSWRLSSALGGAVLLAGCMADHKPALPLVGQKPATVSVKHYLGTPLSGTVLVDPPAFKPEDALDAEVTFFALEKSPEGVDPLGARARLIIASHGSNPVRSTGGLTRSASYAVGGDADVLQKRIFAGLFERRVPVGSAGGALPPGVTARFEITDSVPSTVTLPSGLGHRRFQVQICRPQKFLFTRDKGAATRPATQPDDGTTGPTTIPTTAPSAATEPAATAPANARSPAAQSASTDPAARASSVTAPATTAPTATIPASTAPASAAPISTAPSAVTQANTAPTSAAPATTDLAATDSPNTRPANTQPAPGPAGVAPSAGDRSAVEIQFAVELDDIAAADARGGGDSTDAAPAAAGKPQPLILHMETVLLDPLLLSPQSAGDPRPTAILAVPFRLLDGQNQAIVAIVRISKPSPNDAAHRAACDRVKADLLASYALAKNDAAARPTPSPDEATVTDLLASISHPQTRRAATAYLAAWSGARFCEDVTLSSDDKTLAGLTAQFAPEIVPVAAQKPAVGWRLDRLTLRFLLKLQNDGALPSELAAILTDRAGEAGRHASAMEEILRDVAGPVDLDQRLVATNRLYLEDSSPGARARAYDWLKNRNRHEEPSGYIPLSPARDRRAALEKDLLDRAAAATQPSTQPTGVQ